jgi:hypothetical protein
MSTFQFSKILTAENLDISGFQLQPETAPSFGYFVVGTADMCEHVRQDWTHVAGLAVAAVVLRFKVAALELAFIHAM